MSTTNTLYVAENWLDSSASTSVTVSDTDATCSGVTYSDTNGNYWCYPYYTPYYCWPYKVVEKIPLKLSEVETLRAAAGRNKALKEVLQKFGPHIEIEVDF